MIKLTRRGNQEMILNSDLIETIEETPDTVITLTTGHRHLVRESAAEIVAKIIEFRASVLRLGASPSSATEVTPPEKSGAEPATEED